MKSIVNIAIIGAGYAATLHLRGYKKFTGSNINVKYIIDKDVELAKKLSYDYGIKCFHDDIDLALNDKEINIIDICTPPFTHEDIILKSIKAGKNIICEKPAIGYFSNWINLM
ncbi:Gfo/Idh/MocA family protein [Peptoniphilus grossensis]|uniref:Gfo/Idh/MocA family oxidoreductase n=1 Tax=Peptoniphilus grossensis TaxID=1465756 RepID=A0ABU7XC17_9FIRM